MERTNSEGFTGSLQKLENPSRTEGDGMENTGDMETMPKEGKPQSKSYEYLRDKFIYNPDNLNNFTSTPPNISGRIIQMRPAPIILKTAKNDKHFHSINAKEPKFVPYEPYKGAVNPMVPHESIVRKKKLKRHSTPALIELQEPKINQSLENESPNNSCISSKKNSDCKVDNIDSELEKLKKENEQLEKQLKFQIQVNGDLKNLLVASVGEDMESRVHILTEDKLHLAHALLSSAQKLNTHQEQTEWLAGQCEVWRSKFLASSIMVEELAKWKALLTRRIQDLQDASKHLLEERLKVREYLISLYKDLYELCDNFDVTCLRNGIHKLNSSNIMDLSEVNMQLSAVVRLQLLGNGLEPSTAVNPSSLEPKATAAEALAMELLKHPVPELENADAAYSAVMGAAIAVSSASSAFSPACCGHCTGEIKTI